ncbi:hypothetical protein RchiOBHm_Chr2g0166401 [Rosa chinensis]|uniref:Uncharacterized protein n=1 Tax=Rosa chinensis TaxID=74649 RepID=A0A2P6S425_ROSCH|nr:hypothetical protein RchiOBHm_Chr2g0166401 [Rosa chinensis]
MTVPFLLSCYVPVLSTRSSFITFILVLAIGFILKNLFLLGVFILINAGFSYSMCMDNSWDTLSVSVLSQNCPETFYEPEHSAYLAVELCLAYLYKAFQSTNAISLDNSLEDLISSIFVTAKSIVNCFQPKASKMYQTMSNYVFCALVMQKQLVSAALAFLLIGYKGIREVPTDFCFSKLDEYFKYTSLLLIRFIDGEHFDNLIWQILFN